MICIADGTLQAQLDGELTLQESRHITQHLADCADCRRRADELVTRIEHVHELVSELSPLPGEVKADPFLALARFKARLAAEEVQAMNATSTLIHGFDEQAVSLNGHRPGARVETTVFEAQLSSVSADHLTHTNRVALNFALPESGSFLERLFSALKQFARDFGKTTPRQHPGDTGDFHFLLAYEPLLTRFKRELITAAREFKRDPRGFIAAILVGEGGLPRRHPVMQAGAAMAVMAYACLFTGLVIAGLVKFRAADENKHSDTALVGKVIMVSTPDPNALAKGKGNFAGGDKGKPKPATGGGGGGRKQENPASNGNVPQASLKQQIVMPNPELPKFNSSLPVPMTVYADPNALPKFKGGPIGLPNGVEGPLSSGPGDGAGIGNGKGTGVGVGEGGGVGPGKDGNTGGDKFGIGYEGGKQVFEAGRDDVGNPIILHKEKAQYTEEARQNKVQGTVLLSAIFTADGRVTGIKVVRGLPNGLSESAIEAAQRIQFRPATRKGVAVSVRASIEFTFTIY